MWVSKIAISSLICHGGVIEEMSRPKLKWMSNKSSSEVKRKKPHKKVLTGQVPAVALGRFSSGGSAQGLGWGWGCGGGQGVGPISRGWRWDGGVSGCMQSLDLHHGMVHSGLYPGPDPRQRTRVRPIKRWPGRLTLIETTDVETISLS